MSESKTASCLLMAIMKLCNLERKTFTTHYSTIYIIINRQQVYV